MRTTNRTLAAASVLFAALALLSACGLPGGPACTDEARASVQVTVVDDGGNPVPSPTVTFTSAQNAAAQPCDTFPGSGDDTTFVCGFEVSGDVTVHASADPVNYAPAEKTVTVAETDDGCHVVTQEISLTLQQIDGG
jgi:hypothetical protein